MGPLVSRLSVFLSSSSHNSVNFRSILKNKLSKSKLKIFCQTNDNLFIYLVSKLNDTCTKLCTFYWDTPAGIKVFS